MSDGTCSCSSALGPRDVKPDINDAMEEVDCEHFHQCRIISTTAGPYISPVPVYQADDYLVSSESCQENWSGIPVAKAIPVRQCCHCHAGSSTLTTETLDDSRDEVCSDNFVVRFPSCARPEFIYASVVINDDLSAELDIGIHLESRPTGGVNVASISRTSPLWGSNIAAGDHIVAVNNLYCSNDDIERVTALITASKKRLSLCVHNRQGDPTLVSSSITKPKPTAKVGITLKRKNGIISVKELTDDSLFQDSLITPRQRCVSINGVPCEQLTAHSASELIGAAVDQVIIISEIQEYRAVTIASYGPVAWWRKLAAGVAFG